MTAGGGRWVTFDCFGTIVDWNATLVGALAGVLPDASAAELARRFHDAELAVKHDGPYRRYRDVLAAATAVVARDLGAALPAGANPVAERWGEAAPFADAAAGLRALQERGWRLGILTNCDDDLFALTRARLPVPFDEVVTAEQVRSYKPDLAHFEELRRRAAPQTWVHAANSFVHDVLPAERLGLPRVWVDRDGSGHDAAHASARIEDFTRLAETVEAVAAA